MQESVVRPLFRLLQAALVCAVSAIGCSSGAGDAADVEKVIRRYNELVIQGYRTQNMNPMQEVTTPEQAVKLYHHMAALGEGKLRMDSSLKGMAVKRVEMRSFANALVETEERWDFTHYRMGTGEKYAEEKDFIYRMGYLLRKQGGRWLITEVTTIGGTSTNSVIPFPLLDRKGNRASGE